MLRDSFKHAVLDFLGAQSHATAAVLARFREREWTRSYRWLDENGIALYLADRLKQVDRFRNLPPAVQGRLAQNLRDSRLRAQQLFEEFSRVVRAFSDTGARFIVHKGFALVPEYCPDATLRTQVDMDFQIGGEGKRLFSDVLASLGYRQVRVLDGELTFDTRPDHTPSIADIYKPRSSFRVELHFDGSDINHIKAMPAAKSIENKTLSGLTFPVLNKAETFLHQAAHITQHFRCGWVRLSMLYEFRHFLQTNADDVEFWNAIRHDWQCEPVRNNLAYALALVECSFGRDGRTKQEIGMAGLPPNAKLWMNNCGRKYLVARYPGSKLQLLLGANGLAENRSVLPGCRPGFRRFVPWRSAIDKIAAVFRAAADNGAPSRELAWVRYLLMHHLRTNTQYVVHKIAWRRALRRAQLSS
jgi:hypothetical protein